MSDVEMNPALLGGVQSLPFDNEAESSVLSAMMLSPDALQDALVEVREDDFYNPQNRLIFEAMRRLFDDNRPVDPVSLADQLTSEGNLERAGGQLRILDLAASTFALANWRSHVGILRKNSTLRNMILASSQIMALASSSPSDTREVVDKAERMLLSVTDRDVRSSYSTLQEVIESVYVDLVERADTEQQEGVKTGFPGIDRSLLGLRSGQMVVVGARPGVGKTSFCLNLAVNAAESGATVALFSLEMSKEEIGQRLISSRSGVPLHDIRSYKIWQGDWDKILDAVEELRNLPILIDDTPGITVTEIRAKARRMLHNRPNGIAIIDYLQLLSSTNRSDNRATAVGEMSRGIKIMAKDLGIPVVALSQLNREVEGRVGKRPQLSDLRESGSIEQDADIVILLDRSMTPEEADMKDRPDEGVTNFIIAKNRSGPLGTIPMRFDSSIIKFVELAVFDVPRLE